MCICSPSEFDYCVTLFPETGLMIFFTTNHHVANLPLILALCCPHAAWSTRPGKTWSLTRRGQVYGDGLGAKIADGEGFATGSIKCFVLVDNFKHVGHRGHLEK